MARASEPFGSVPKRLSEALYVGDLTWDEFGLLAWLICNVNYHLPDPLWRGTTKDLAESLRWEYTVKHLGKLLRRLHAGGWIESTAQPRSPRPFTIALRKAACQRPGFGICDACGAAADDVWQGSCGSCRT